MRTLQARMSGLVSFIALAVVTSFSAPPSSARETTDGKSGGNGSVLEELAQARDFEARLRIIIETDFTDANIPELPPSCSPQLWRKARVVTETLDTYLNRCEFRGHEIRGQAFCFWLS